MGSSKVVLLCGEEPLILLKIKRRFDSEGVFIPAEFSACLSG